MHKIYIFLLLSFLIISCATHVQIPPSAEKHDQLEILKDDISYLLQDPNLFMAQVGLYIESLDNGEVIFHRNEHKLFIPASNMKLYTSAVALLKFGPQFRFQTRFYQSGVVENGRLEGDLIIKGGGDPSFNNHHQSHALAIMNSWIDSLKSWGINQISGDIIADVSYFQTSGLGSGWEWDDEIYYYAAKMNALSFNDNCVDITVSPNIEIGLAPKVSIYPPTSYINIQNNAKTGKPDSLRTLSVWRERSSMEIQIDNEIPINFDPYKTSITVEDPALFFITVFKELLISGGIHVKGSLKVESGSNLQYEDDNQLLFIHYSPSLSELIGILNKKSHNFYAEQFLLTLGAEYGDAGTAGEGIEVVEKILRARGISENSFMMYDGSGLSRKSLISPVATATLLRSMARSRYFEHYLQSLPVAGVDGTLKYRMQNTAAEGKVFAKTGYISHVRNLSGYATSADDEWFLFSILVNHYAIPTPAINLLQDRICERIARFKRHL